MEDRHPLISSVDSPRRIMSPLRIISPQRSPTTTPRNSNSAVCTSKYKWQLIMAVLVCVLLSVYLSNVIVGTTFTSKDTLKETLNQATPAAPAGINREKINTETISEIKEIVKKSVQDAVNIALVEAVGKIKSDAAEKESLNQVAIRNAIKEAMFESSRSSAETSTTIKNSEEPKIPKSPETSDIFSKEKLIASVKQAAFNLDAQIAKLKESPEIGNSSMVTRGVAIYLPPANAKYFTEVGYHYLSIAVMRSYQPTNIKTDLLVFTSAESFPDLEAIGCIKNYRKSFSDPEACIIVPYVSVKDRPNHPLKSYSYFNSIDILASFDEKIALVYNFLVRTDIDTFFTPGFADFLPPQGKTLLVGQGGYSSENAVAHLKWIALQRLGLRDDNMKDVGSTWYGPSILMIKTAQLCVESMIWLHTQEFNDFELSPHAGTLGWPHWHWPVLTMYAGHLAVNHLGESFVQKAKFDNSPTLKSPLLNEIKHIHVWHGDEMFSKFAFDSGQYKNFDLGPFSDMKSHVAFVSSIAISSSRLNNSEYRSIVADQDKVKQRLWFRQFLNSTSNVLT